MAQRNILYYLQVKQIPSLLLSLSALIKYSNCSASATYSVAIRLIRCAKFVLAALARGTRYSKLKEKMFMYNRGQLKLHAGARNVHRNIARLLKLL